MKDLGEAKVIFGIRIIKVRDGVCLTQSHYIEKVLKRFNYFDYVPISTPMDPSLKLVPNEGSHISHVEYFKVIELCMQ